MDPQTRSRWSTSKSRLIALVAAAALIVIWVWNPFQQPGRLHVLLVTLDTTRADRIGCYGYSAAATPTIDSLAAEGTLFERAYTPAPLTLPAHASLMTSLLPPEHGLVTNGKGHLSHSVSTLAEVLRDAGYDTGAFIGSFVLNQKFGLHRGFNIYDDNMINTDPTPDGLHRQRDGAWVVDAALKWLRADREKPFFCWVHLYDAHAPYLAHEKAFGTQYIDEPYDGGIAYVDRQVARLVHYLRSEGLSERTLIIVAGDHGEGLGEHGEQEHGFTLYDNVMRVPCVWHGTGVAAKSHRVPNVVSLVDVRPTLLDLLKLRDPAATSGRSLANALKGLPIRETVCYMGTDFPLIEQGWCPQWALISAEWKYIRSTETELYDLRADPTELRNLAVVQPEVVLEMEERLLAMEDAFTFRAGSDVILSSQEQRALESLGYLSGRKSSQPSSDANRLLPDVKAMLPIYNSVRSAQKKLNEGHLAEAELLLRKVSLEWPDYLPARLFLSDALRRQQKFDDARLMCENVLDRDPECSEAHFHLGNVHLDEGRYTEAAEEYRAFLSNRPGVIEVLFNLAQCQVKLGLLDAAEKTLVELLDHDPLFVQAHVQLGNLLFRRQRMGAAEDHYREAIRYTPNTAEAHVNLAVILASQQRMEEAGPHFVKAVKLAPRNAEVQFQFGMYMLTLGRKEDAVQALESTLRLDPQHSQAKTRLQQVQSLRNK